MTLVLILILYMTKCLVAKLQYTSHIVKT